METTNGGGGHGHNLELGMRGEDVACLFLERRGLEILERNWRCKSGEADIIALDTDALVFVEVKTRSSESNGLPEEAVTPEKRRRYEEIALAYLRNFRDFSCITVRFDVVAITLLGPDRAFLRYHKDAFGSGF